MTGADALREIGTASDPNQFNSIGRPATILVSAGGAHVMRRRETPDDIFARHVIPPHLAPIIQAEELCS